MKTLALAAEHSALVVSDIHLDAQSPALTQLFISWLKAQLFSGPGQPDWLILLGDIFDAWVGDDLLDAAEHPQAEPARALIAVLERAHAAGVHIGILGGNRDFLLGGAFAAHAHADLLPEPFVMEHPALGRVVVCHGDALCTDDANYQRFRELVRSPQWQKTFLAKPLAERLSEAQAMRAQSEQYKASASMDIMDINPAAAQALLEKAQADVLLHGHTHRPGCSLLPKGKPRWVSTDWHAGKTPRGGGLLINSQGMTPLNL
ncbi:MAG: UDP-2,3-diacylglucosamine diphosphatase [Betaproteobacteria bacterium]|nr:UDP-2,3-diacylglucosamine diphosphatase [Betaproteobacteria bacterium]NBT74946.1 UDP-2,3-diacylglucosamine diphosphatase [Betaproteobacteria bacterium]NBY13244.1 UDP-2,3-diacylglucosamine diphosphatase [Betaproteobacteria bacterium]NCA16827.1 UDP-2,3-diacylglucosamine diphosphatase [Betaproteobacteria bacterium]